MRLKKRKISTEPEKKIITGAIVSTQYCRDLKAMYRKEYFKLDYAKIILKWIFDYFDEYSRAPERNIQDIFEVEKETITEAEAEVIKLFLFNLSEDYDDKNFNIEYLLDRTRDYFTERSLALHYENGYKLIQAGRINEAEELLTEHKKVIMEVSDRFNPFDEEEIKNHDLENNENRLFTFDGAVGELFGWFERDWLVALTAPEKRGKSWLIEEFVFRSLMHNLNVFWFSLEMNKNQIKDRFYRRLTVTSDESKEIKYPLFDCAKNQYGECKKGKRKNEIDLYDENDEMISGKRLKAYKICDACRGTENFEPAIFYDKYKTKGLTKKQINQSKVKFEKYFGTNLRIKTFPSFSANSYDMKKELDDAEFSENFIPDVIVHDYIDIQGNEKGLMGRDDINAKWQMAKNIADTKHCLFVTADQANAKGRYVESLTQENFSEDKRKDAHLDMRIGINQVADEKDEGITRLSVLFHRHAYFNEHREVMILQALDIAQPMLDSEWKIKKKKEK